MTKEEAKKIIIKWLNKGKDGKTKERLGYLEGWFHDKDEEAFNIAVKELEQEPTTKNDLGVDCIPRVEAIDYLCKHCPDNGECFKDCDEIKHLRNIPSATPQESFKPMVEIDLYSVIKQKYVEREVLDKIRAEIENINLNEVAMKYEDRFMDFSEKS